MKIRPCLCIPVFDNGATVARIVAECLEKFPYPVLVVDDGSREPVWTKLSESPRLRVLRSTKNRGKGVALQRAFADCVAHGFTHAVTLDADGQHLPQELPKLVAVAEASPWAVILGSRNLGGGDVPRASRFGRWFSNFWVRYETDAAVSDSQSGFRVYPLFPLQTMRFFTKRFEFEIEVLIRLLWRGVEVREVPVEVHYPTAAERVSHFRKFRDNARISALNTALVAVTLLRSRRSPALLGAACAVGALIGSTPLFGLHTALALAAAVLLRLNAGAVWLGTQISIPPLAPFLAVASIAAGKKLAPGVESTAVQWALGSLAVGAGAGALVGGVVYLAASRLSSAGRALWNGRDRGGKLGPAILRLVLRLFGLRAAYFCLEFIVPYFYLFAPRAVRASREYWRTVQPQLSWLETQRRVLRQFRALGRLLLDRMYQAGADHPRFAGRPNGFRNITGPIVEGTGALLVSAHVGGWDMAAAHLTVDGVREPFHPFRYDESFAGGGPQPVLAIRAQLEKGRAVGIMADRPVGRHFALVPFFGKLAAFDTTPFRIAAACGKPLLFTFGFKSGLRTYDFYAFPAKRYAVPPGADRADAETEWAREAAAVTEVFVRRYPDQWFNFFPFWSAPPSAPPMLPPQRSAPAWRTPEPQGAA